MSNDSAAAPEPGILELSEDAMIDRLIEERVEQRIATRLESDALHWRLRLVAAETCVMGLLVFVAGVLLGQPTMLVLRASLMVAGSCLATGVLLLGLSAGAIRLTNRVKRRLRQ